jgi:hypothetical protein
MTTEFLVFANVWLFARFICLFRDTAATGRAWRNQALAELAIALVLFPTGAWWIGFAFTLMGLNVAGYWLDRRAVRRDFARLRVGFIGLCAVSVWLSAHCTPGFRPELAAWAGRVGTWTSLAPLVDALAGRTLHLVFFGLLLSANEANLVIRAMFDWLDLKPRMRSPENTDLNLTEIDVGEFNRGRVIGILERGLLYGFVLQGQYGAIGFVLAAKAFTRFKALENRSFAEYVLIGTLLSACLALATGGMVRWLLRS